MRIMKYLIKFGLAYTQGPVGRLVLIEFEDMPKKLNFLLILVFLLPMKY